MIDTIFEAFNNYWSSRTQANYWRLQDTINKASKGCLMLSVQASTRDKLFLTHYRRDYLGRMYIYPVWVTRTRIEVGGSAPESIHKNIVKKVSNILGIR